MDVEDAKRLFGGGPIRIKEVKVQRQEFAVAMQADEFERNDDYIEVLAIAERLLDYLNGALFLADTTRRPLRILSGGTVCERSESGLYDRRSVLGRLSGRSRVRFTLSGTLTAVGGQPPTMEQEPQQPVEAEALSLSVRDEAVAEILSYLRTDPDHASLFLAYERLKRDVREAKDRWSASGCDGVAPDFPWAYREDRNFTQSAQPFRHGDPSKWAGKTQLTAMPLLEARGLVSGWVRKWLEWKRANS